MNLCLLHRADGLALDLCPQRKLLIRQYMDLIDVKSLLIQANSTELYGEYNKYIYTELCNHYHKCLCYL